MNKQLYYINADGAKTQLTTQIKTDLTKTFSELSFEFLADEDKSKLSPAEFMEEVTSETKRIIENKYDIKLISGED